MLTSCQRAAGTHPPRFIGGVFHLAPAVKARGKPQVDIPVQGIPGTATYQYEVARENVGWIMISLPTTIWDRPEWWLRSMSASFYLAVFT
jgi:hypothetical protein